MIEIDSLVKKFGRRKVINGLNLKIDKGDFLVIFGANGAGKTTLINLLSTLLRPSSGTVLIDGVDNQENGSEVRKSIGVLAHKSYLYDELSASENLKFYAKMYGVPAVDKRIEELLALVRLSHRMDDLVGTFSRGMRQRLAIARAIIHDPRVLLLDEPYTGLDLNGGEILSKMLRKFHHEERTTVMATHDVGRGYEIGERLAVMSDGGIAADFRKEETGLDEFKKRYRELLGAA
ncbi:MAG: heme ABC exporter ATP-binding protein CcmA [Thermoplasmata archaeon]